MLKKLFVANWGKWSAVAGVLIFVGLAASPLVMRAIGADSTLPKEMKGGWGDEKQKKGEMVEVKSAIRQGGSLFLGAKGGLLIVEPGKPAGWVKDFPASDVRSLMVAGDKVLAGTKQGAFLQDGTKWEKVYDGDVHHLSGDSGVFLLTDKHAGVFESTDGGKTWNQVKIELSPELAQSMPPEAAKKKKED